MPQIDSIQAADMQLKLLEDRLNIGTWRCDIDTSRLMWSAGLYRILGADPATIEPSVEHYQSLLHPEDQNAVTDPFSAFAEPGIPVRKFRIIRPDGAMRWLESSMQTHFNRDGDPILISGLVADVSDAEQLKTKLRAETRFGEVLTRMLEGFVWRAHPDGRLIESKEWVRITGQESEEYRTKERANLVHPDDREAYVKAWSDARASGTHYFSSVRIRSKAGHYVRATGRAYPFFDVTGHMQYWIGHTVIGEVAERVAEQVDEGLTAGQIRAARAFLDWSAMDLADRSGVSFSTIRRIESMLKSVRPDTVLLVRDTLERNGVVFGTRGGHTVSYTPLPPSSPRLRQ